VVDKLTLAQVFLLVLRHSLASATPSVLPTH